MTLEEIYDMVRTDDFMEPRKMGKYSHPYSEAAERITQHEVNPDYKPKHRKTADEIRESM